MAKYIFVTILFFSFSTSILLATSLHSKEIDLNPKKHFENRETEKNIDLHSHTQRKNILRIDGIKYYVVGNPSIGELLIPKLDHITSEEINLAKCANSLHSSAYFFDKNGRKTKEVRNNHKDTMVIGGRIPLNRSLSLFSNLIISNIKSRCNPGNTSDDGRTWNMPNPHIDLGVSKKWGGRRPKESKAFI